MRTIQRALVLLVTTMTSLMLAGSAQAVALEVDAGWFRPWDQSSFYLNPDTARLESPSTGWYVAGAIMGTGSSGRARFGAQFEYQNYVADGPDITAFFIPFRLGLKPNVEWDTWALRFLFQYHFLPDSIIQPYIGASLGFTINRFDNRIYRFAAPFADSQNLAPGVEGTALAGIGIMIPGVDWLSIFGEAKFGYNAAFPLTEAIAISSSVEVLNLGGMEFGGGVRFRF
jgi:hypothetical protein